MLTKLRRGALREPIAGNGQPKPPRPEPMNGHCPELPTITVRLDPMDAKALSKAADLRGLSASQFAADLLTVISQDLLFDAVADDC